MKIKGVGRDQLDLLKIAVSSAFMAAWQDFVEQEGSTRVTQNTTVLDKAGTGEKYRISVLLSGKSLSGDNHDSVGLMPFLKDVRIDLALAFYQSNNKTPVSFSGTAVVFSYGKFWEVNATFSIA